MVEKIYSLKNLNTFGIDASAALFADIDSIEALESIWKGTLIERNKPLILGGGSNMLLLNNYHGLALKNSILGKTIIHESESEITVEFGGGENWHETVLWAVESGYGGIENLSLIPGTVGAAPIQNIGAYGVELESVFVNLIAFNFITGITKVFNKEDCKFGYRDSVFKNEVKDQYFILKVQLKFQKQPKLKLDYGDVNAILEQKGITNPNIKDVSNAIIEIRQSKLPDPAKLGNSGSFFKNPIVEKSLALSISNSHTDLKTFEVDENHVKIPAGWLIEKAGWKGKRIGNVGMHEKQALVLVNYGGATGAELWNHAQAVIEDVNEKFGIRLQAEVNLIG